MRVISVPKRLRLAAGLLVLGVPLAALQTIIVTRSPWWKLPYEAIQLWSVAVGLICVPLAYWITKGLRWAFHCSVVFAVIWNLLSLWITVSTQNSTLGFFSLFLLFFWLGLLFWVHLELGRSFFDPKLQWYQGLPRPIPGLHCSLEGAGLAALELRVSRMDLDGLFAFSSTKTIPDLSKDARVSLLLNYKARSIRCNGIPVRSLAQRNGMGFQFDGMSSDALKELSDFVEFLRGEGHA